MNPHITQLMLIALHLNFQMTWLSPLLGCEVLGCEVSLGCETVLCHYGISSLQDCG